MAVRTCPTNFRCWQARAAAAAASVEQLFRRQQQAEAKVTCPRKAQRHPPRRPCRRRHPRTRRPFQSERCPKPRRRRLRETRHWRSCRRYNNNSSSSSKSSKNSSSSRHRNRAATRINWSWKSSARHHQR